MSLPRIWIGRWVVGVAILHTLFGIAVFHPTLLAMVQNGLWDSVGTDPMAGAVSWFLLFGIAMLAAGLAINTLERSAVRPPIALGITLLLMTVCGVILMPASGFYLLLPAIAALLIGRTRSN
jgi:hypothetical protein